jgi:hypothetical protein
MDLGAAKDCLPTATPYIRANAIHVVNQFLLGGIERPACCQLLVITYMGYRITNLAWLLLPKLGKDGVPGPYHSIWTAIRFGSEWLQRLLVLDEHQVFNIL